MNELKDYFLSDTEINEGEVSLPFWKAKIQRLRTDPTARKKVREQLLPQTSSLLEEINIVFVAARKALRELTPEDGGAGYSDFVLILDNLEKIQRLAKNEPGDASQRAPFIEGAPQLNALDAHLVITVPLALVLREGNLLQQIYGKHLHRIPMVKTELRGPEHPPFEKGRQKLAELLARRVPSGVSLADVFDDDALDVLIEYSAGHIRSLMMYARESTLYAKRTLPIPLPAVEQTIGESVGIMVDTLRQNDWQLLAELELSKRQEWHSNGPDQRRLLENLCVLAYVNGGNESRLKKSTPWYAVNPVLRVQDAFEDAVAVAKKSSEVESVGV